jgi:hypothetical protein
MLEEGVVLLGGDGPVLKRRTETVICSLHYWRAFKCGKV